MTKPDISLMNWLGWLFDVSTLAGLLGSSAYVLFG
jgi:hypothetical protein